MAIEIRLNSEQFSHYEEVLNKSKIEFKHRGSIIELTKDNYYTIRNTLQDAKDKLVLLKTKKPNHMERLYYLQEILIHIDRQASHFPVASEEVEEVETDAISILDNKLFEIQEAIAEEVAAKETVE